MAYFYRRSASEVKAVEKEAARYSGCKLSDLENDASLKKLVSESCKKLNALLMPQLVYQEYDLSIEKAESGSTCISFADVKLESQDLGKNLENCKKIVLFAGTVGPMVDRAIKRAQNDGSAEAAVMQGTGAMFIESFVDDFNEHISEEYRQKGMKTHPRYSPGYGDVPLEIQKEFFRLLPCEKIGLTLMESLIMAPEKSVTAFIGVE